MSVRRAAVVLLVATAPLHAQGVADSVEVKTGDTLWSLAATRLGSPYRWPAISAANADRVNDPHWIYPGQRLRIPGAPPATPAADSAPTADTVAATAPPDDSVAEPLPTTIRWTDEAPPPAAPAPAPAPVVAPRPVGWPGLDSASRFFVHASMPYLAERGELASAGTLVADAEVTGRPGAGAKRRFALHDHVVVTAPRGAAGAREGGLLVVARPSVDGRGRAVVLPTALARVNRVAGDLVVVELVRVFDAVEPGQRVLSGADLGWRMVEGAHASRKTTRVDWIAGDAELPTVASVMILGAGSADGVEIGDRFELVGPDRRAAGRTLPGVPVAIARVMRVTERSATAIVIAQDEPGIRLGMTARPLGRDERRPNRDAP